MLTPPVAWRISGDAGGVEGIRPHPLLLSHPRNQAIWSDEGGVVVGSGGGGREGWGQWQTSNTNTATLAAGLLRPRVTARRHMDAHTPSGMVAFASFGDINLGGRELWTIRKVHFPPHSEVKQISAVEAAEGGGGGGGKNTSTHALT